MSLALALPSCDHTGARVLFLMPGVAIYLALRGIFGLSYPRIGQLINRDHTGIIYGVRKIKTPEFQRHFPDDWERARELISFFECGWDFRLRPQSGTVPHPLGAE